MLNILIQIADKLNLECIHFIPNERLTKIKEKTENSTFLVHFLFDFFVSSFSHHTSSLCLDICVTDLSNFSHIKILNRISFSMK